MFDNIYTKIVDNTCKDVKLLGFDILDVDQICDFKSLGTSRDDQFLICEKLVG